MSRFNLILKHAAMAIAAAAIFCGKIYPQKGDPFKPDFSAPAKIAGMTLVWNDEFNIDGRPDSLSWRFEKGFVRNQELQWYQPENAVCKNGVLLIAGKRDKIKNPRFKEGGSDWKQNREYAEYSSASLNTRGMHEWLFGRFEIRARIDTSSGSWPAIWTLGKGGWPEGGEIDIMEFYKRESQIILANFAWGTEVKYKAKWNEKTVPLKDFLRNDPDWVKKFHMWRMDWDRENISIYLDDVLINSQQIKEAVNPDGSIPFLKPNYILLNLAIGSNGGDPSVSKFPINYEVDYVRVYQKN